MRDDMGHIIKICVLLFLPFLGAVAKLRKATINFVMPVRMEHLCSHAADFHEFLYLSIFRKKNCLENSGSIKIGQE
jgi:hypothetical protein